METILLVITILSIVSTAAALAALTRTRRDERQRSEARIAALASAANAPGAADDGVWKQMAGEWRWNTGNEGARAENFFGTVQRGEATTGRLPLFAAAILIILLGSGLVFLRAPSGAGVTAPAAAATRTDPIELMSLGHSREATSLTITGIVRNPIAGHKLEGLTAVVSLLDNDGGLVSTKDVPLDYRALGPGEEAPFKVSVPDPGSVARYRVSFRAGTEVIPHVDRRIDTKLASALR